MKKIIIVLLLFVICLATINSEDGYRLWLRYDKIDNQKLLEKYQAQLNGFYFEKNSSILNSAKEELQLGLTGLLGKEINEVENISDGVIIAGTHTNSSKIASLISEDQLINIGDEGYIISSKVYEGKNVFVITSNNDIGVLYGVFHFLRLIQTHQDINEIHIESSPKIKLRVINHWDNLDRTVERGYAGFSIWDWHKLPEYIESRYKDYARANASIGINGTAITNVNANALIFSPYYLERVKALADVFRSYGIKIYLTARFSAPIEIGGLESADPLESSVQEWWNNKVKEIYDYIPDFGGFLVKADSEGQPGPHNYNRSHAEGANMLADALKPFGGVVMWRAFVYDFDVKEDRAKQAYNQFVPLDGKFKDNIFIQVKNGAIDFQPREPFHPMFGAQPKTNLMMEFQITQEYLGQATTLAYLAPMWKEVLDSDTFAEGDGSTVAKVIDGTLDNHEMSGIAGVSNIGTDRNWTGHTFGQANWYAYGRLAWNHRLSSEQIAEEWIRMTFGNRKETVEQIKHMMLISHETIVNYMTPLGLHHIMGWDHHYGPAPWIKDKHRDDWTSVYYHRADETGIGFDRTEIGSNAISQYLPEVAENFGSLEECPEKYLLWFHHVPWKYEMKSGNTLWEEMVYKYYEGVDSVKSIRRTWETLSGKIDEERFNRVSMLLKIQEKEAIWWRNACLLYFQTFSNKPIPKEVEQPDKTLEYYMNLNFPYAPGIKPQW